MNIDSPEGIALIKASLSRQVPLNRSFIVFKARQDARQNNLLRSTARIFFNHQKGNYFNAITFEA